MQCSLMHAFKNKFIYSTEFFFHVFLIFLFKRHLNFEVYRNTHIFFFRKMSEKNAEQIKSLYTELAKVAPSQDWEKILKTAKKSRKLEYTSGQLKYYLSFFSI